MRMDPKPTWKFSHFQIQDLPFVSANLKRMIKGEKTLFESLQAVISRSHQIIISDSGRKNSPGNL
jgi:hypothetical protein